MNIDYDAINDWAATRMERERRQMIDALQDAMRDGDITKCRIPFRWEICGGCDGDGHHSRHLGVIDPDDWDEEHLLWLKQGVYDHRCEPCAGTGKVRVIEDDLLPDDVRAWIEDYEKAAYDDIMCRRGEMMMGA